MHITKTFSPVLVIIWYYRAIINMIFGIDLWLNEDIILSITLNCLIAA